MPKSSDYNINMNMNLQNRPTISQALAQTKPPYFADKKVLITGASSGVGMALAYWYLNNGAQVALVGRDIETLTKIGE